MIVRWQFEADVEFQEKALRYHVGSDWESCHVIEERRWKTATGYTNPGINRRYCKIENTHLVMTGEYDYESIDGAWYSIWGLFIWVCRLVYGYDELRHWNRLDTLTVDVPVKITLQIKSFKTAR